MTTIFSKIIDREVPANIVYEDNLVLAFLDINPVNKGHILVIPREPSVDGLETPPETMAHIVNIGQKIGNVQKEILGCTGVNFIMNNGEDAGQDVFHTHLHVVPRFKDDKRFTTPTHDKYAENEANSIAEKIAKSL